MTLSEYFAAERGRIARMEASTGLSASYLSQIARGSRPVPLEHAAAIELASAGALRRWDMRPDDWHRIWPELVGAEGAPAVQAQEAA